MKAFNTCEMRKIEEIEDIIESLPKPLKRKFLRGISTFYLATRDQLKNMIENEAFYIRYDGDRIATTIFIYGIYEALGINDKEIEKHWKHVRKAQAELHWSYSAMAKNPRQDNKDSLNHGNGQCNAYSLRRPKLCRKTAWKRFYKLFPRLKK